VIIGANFMRDDDGIFDASSGSLITRPAQEGYSFDFTFPIADRALTPYFEFASLTDHGNGTVGGVKGELRDWIRYGVEYRYLNSQFVPGYFNQSYESTSFDFQTDAIQRGVSGYLAHISADLFDQQLTSHLTYENYAKLDLLTAGFHWEPFFNLGGDFQATVPFQGKDQATLLGAMNYKVSSFMSYVFKYKRVYQSRQDFTESYTVGMQFQL